MKFHPVKYSELSVLPKIIRDYISSVPELKAFYEYPFDFGTFNQVITKRKFSEENRQVLTAVLRQQYQFIQTTNAVKKNIEKLLHKNTYCITTAHQPVLFTGPFYVIYKIISAINLAEQLCKTYPDKHFVPVYCMGAEDHDFEEINHTWLNGEKIEWHQENKGAVGRLSTKKIVPLITTIEKYLAGKPHADEIINTLKEAYGNHSTLAEATLYLIDKLFGDYGLVVLIPDNKNLKKLFSSVIREELLHNYSFTLSEQTSKKLDSLGYQTQVNPREINLFYLADNIRERIVLDQQITKYEVLNTSLSFTRDEILKMVEEHPENFSPNVVLRPLYQETILPNLAYVGGAGELSYWLQQKNIFEHYKVDFPMLVLRNSALMIDANTSRKIDKIGIELNELFDDEEALIQNFIKKNSNHSLDLTTEKEQINNVFDQVKAKSSAIDSTLSGYIEAQKAGALKGFEGLETKIMRAEKRNFEIAINQIKSVKSKLFPTNILQERMENFLPWYAQYGSSFLNILKQEFDPFSKEFAIVLEES